MKPTSIAPQTLHRKNYSSLIASAGLALLVGLAAPAARASFTVYYLDSEFEAPTENCSSGERGSCLADWNPANPASLTVNAQGSIVKALQPDIFGSGEYINDTFADTGAAETYFSNAFMPGFDWSPHFSNNGNWTVVTGWRYWSTNGFPTSDYVSSGQISGLDLNLCDFGAGTCDSGIVCPDTWYPAHQPFQTTLQVPGLTNPLHIFVVQLTPREAGRTDCENTAQLASLASYLTNTYLTGPYKNDPYILMGDTNENLAYQTLATTATGLNVVPCNLTSDLSNYNTLPSGTDPVHRLDYIMVSSGLVGKVRISHTYSNTVASDHDAVYCTIGCLNPDVISLSDGSLQVSAVHAPVITTTTGGNVISKDNATPDYFTRSPGAGGTWSAPSSIAVTAPLPAQLEKTIAGMNANGIAQEFALGADHHVYTANNSGGSWGSGWTDLGASALVVDIVVAQNNSPGNPHPGILELFAIGEDGSLWSNNETAANAYASWSGWTKIGSVGLTAASSLAVGHELNGDLHVFYLGSDKRAYHTYWTGTAWSANAALGGTVQQLALEFSASGRFVVWTADAAGSVSHIAESAANSPSSWGSWVTAYTGQNAASIAYCFDGNGNDAAFFTNGVTGVTYTAISVGGVWPTSPTNLGGVSDCVSAILRSDGCIELFQISTTGVLMHNVQTSIGSAFSGWQSLGGSEL